jgi:hypothetical protein
MNSNYPGYPSKPSVPNLGKRLTKSVSKDQNGNARWKDLDAAVVDGEEITGARAITVYGDLMYREILGRAYGGATKTERLNLQRTAYIAGMIVGDATQPDHDGVKRFGPREILAIQREFDRIMYLTPEPVVQKRRKRQADYAKKKRATEPKPEMLLAPDERLALVFVDGSPLKPRERQALLNLIVTRGEPAADAGEERARSRMRSVIKQTSREVLSMLANELIGQLTSIARDTRKTREMTRETHAMVKTLLNAQLIAPLHEEIDSITRERDWADLGGIGATPPVRDPHRKTTDRHAA